MPDGAELWTTLWKYYGNSHIGTWMVYSRGKINWQPIAGWIVGFAGYFTPKRMDLATRTIAKIAGVSEDKTMHDALM